MGFGKRLKEILKNKGITIKELAELTGISINTLYSITKRDTLMPDIEIIEKIVSALNIDKTELLTYEVVSNNIRVLLEKEKEIEDSNRATLYEVTKMLNTEALIELSKVAIDLLKDEAYISPFYNNPKFQ